MSRLSNSISQEREEWVRAWSKMMVDIWREKIDLLNVNLTGNLYQQLAEASFYSQDEVYEIIHSFPYYGIFVDRGTGKEIPIGNSGDLGFTPTREPKKWLSPKHYASIMKLRDFMADSFGQEAITLIKDKIEIK